MERQQVKLKRQRKLFLIGKGKGGLSFFLPFFSLFSLYNHLCLGKKFLRAGDMNTNVATWTRMLKRAAPQVPICSSSSTTSPQHSSPFNPAMRHSDMSPSRFTSNKPESPLVKRNLGEGVKGVQMRDPPVRPPPQVLVTEGTPRRSVRVSTVTEEGEEIVETDLTQDEEVCCDVWVESVGVILCLYCH